MGNMINKFELNKYLNDMNYKINQLKISLSYQYCHLFKKNYTSSFFKTKLIKEIKIN